MRIQRLTGAGELVLALVCVLVAVWQWTAGVGFSRTPVQLPGGEQVWLTVYDGPHVISVFALAAAAILLLVDGAVRLRRAREYDGVPRP